MLSTLSTLTLGAWFHDLSPFILEVSPGIGLRWYGTAYALGFLAGWWVLRFLSTRGVTPLSVQQVTDMLLVLAAGVILGGRVGYALFYEQKIFITFDKAFPFWQLLRVHQGGMAFHGAVLGVMAAAWWIARQCNKPLMPGAQRIGWRHVMDLLAIASTVGLGMGRLANFINGELYGKVVAFPGAKAPWWSVKFPQEIASKAHTDALKAAGKFGEFQNFLVPYLRDSDRTDDEFVTRVLRAVQAGGEPGKRVASQLEPLLTARHPSQLYQAFFEGVVLTALLWIVWRTPRKAGVVGCWFLIGYGVLRIVAENYRVPDEQIGRSLGFSRGQWLCTLMVVGGFATLAWIVREGDEVRGGWKVGQPKA